MLIGASYAGSAGHFLSGAGGQGIWTNSIPVGDLALGALLNAQATPANIAAAAAIVPGAALPFTGFTGTIAQMLKPFPQYSGVALLWGNRGSSSWNSIQLTFDRRLTKGLFFHAGFTHSKELDNLAASRNPFNGGLERAVGTIDRPNVFVSDMVYRLPFGTGHKWGAGNPVVKSLVSDWSLSVLLNFTSEPPLSITGSGCNTPGISSTCIVSYNPNFSGPISINGGWGSGNALSPGAASYINKAAFMDPAPYTFGNLPRTAPYGLFSPALFDEDISLRREITLRERLRFSIEANCFNVTNSVYFNAPGTSIDSANFGQVTSQRSLPRKFQINARFSF
jgi:hypothetical protein